METELKTFCHKVWLVAMKENPYIKKEIINLLSNNLTDSQIQSVNNDLIAYFLCTKWKQRKLYIKN